jgi:hypothetical protein
MPRFWKKEELQILLDAKNKKHVKVKGRSKKSIRRKLIELGLVEPKYKAKKHNKRRWTNEELKVLHESKDKLNIKIPNRSRHSIISKLGNLGLVEKQKARKPWLKKEDELLKKLVKQGKSAKDIFQLNVLPYSRNSIQKKMGYLGLARKPWLKKEDKLLKRLVKQGKSAKEISQLNVFPYSKNSIQKKIRCSVLAEKQAPAEYFSKETLEIFKKFLVDNWQGKTPEDLVLLWNNKNPTKICKRKVVYHLGKLKIKIPYVEVARINFLRKKEEKLRNSIISPKQLAESLRIIRADMMEKRMLRNRDIWTGLPLSDEILNELNQPL